MSSDDRDKCIAESGHDVHRPMISVKLASTSPPIQRCCHKLVHPNKPSYIAWDVATLDVLVCKRWCDGCTAPVDS